MLDRRLAQASPVLELARAVADSNPGVVEWALDLDQEDHKVSLVEYQVYRFFDCFSR